MSERGDMKVMAFAKPIRAASLAALIMGAALTATAPVDASDMNMPVISVAASDAASRFIPLGLGKSVAIDLPEDIKDVLVADPKIANAVIRSSRRVYMIGVKVGQTNIYFFNAAGKQIAGFDIAVTRDLNGVRAAIRRTLPNANIQIEGVGDGVMLSGTAPSQAEAQQAFDIASRLVGGDTKVVNGIQVSQRDQVLLKVTVAEVQRDVIKQLGIDLSGSVTFGTATVSLNSSNPFSASGSSPSSNMIGTFTGNPSVTAQLNAMERAGVIHTLAEPNLTAISGETATFVAGGEFPIPSGLSCDTTHSPPVCQPQITFKKFGVSLVFTPVVLSEGRISLKVMTEVSDISTDHAMPLQTAGFSSSVPSIITRRADTVVELPSGGSLALAGMIQQKSQQSINGMPGLLQVPILGALFKSRDYLNHQSELVIIVTPYVVHAVAEKQLSRPDDGFEDPSDPQSVLLGRLNRIYGAKDVRSVPTAHYHGKYGFILD